MKKVIAGVFIIISVAFVFIFYSYGQKASQGTGKDKMIVGGDEGIFKKGYTRFSGNAYVEKGSVRMFAEVIEYFETNNLAIGRGNVVLKDLKSGLNVSGGYSEYYGDSNIIYFYQSPYLILSNNNIFLKGDVIILKQNDEIVVSEGNSYLTNNDVEMYANKIEIMSKSNIIKLIKNSKIISTNFWVFSDNGFIITSNNAKTKETEILKYVGIGNVRVVGSNFILDAERIVINFDNNEVSNYIAVGDVKISNQDSFITAGYFRSEFHKGRDVKHIGMTNVSISNFSTGEMLFADYLVSDRVSQTDVFIGNAVYILRDGTKFSAQVIERFVKDGLVIAKKDVILETDNVRVISEFGRYDEKLKMLYMLGNPRVVSSDKLGVSVDVITIDVNKKSAKLDSGNYGYVNQQGM